MPLTRSIGGDRLSRIFLSYRCGDSAYAAALLDERLSRTFGPDQVFRASRSVQPGDTYSDAILQTLKQCAVVLVIIGPRWAEQTDASGTRLLDNDSDWVRTEIATALKPWRSGHPDSAESGRSHQGGRPSDGHRGAGPQTVPPF